MRQLSAGVGCRGEGTAGEERVDGYPVRPKTTRHLNVPDDVEGRRRCLEQLSNEPGNL
ncbi:MAG TPA: hypothetical protein VLV78_23970 [Thermoanaerobaculia bacterium]|nr:hypothetical protein [Thermoanaerobaculia bacterium]